MWKMVVSLVCVCAFGAFVSEEARACQPEPPSVAWISLTDNATGIPTNASFWVMQRGNTFPGDTSITYELTGPSGAITFKQEEEGSLIRITPESALAPNTSYTFSAKCTGERCYAGPDEKKATFMTGTGEFSQSQPYNGANSASSSYVPPYKAQHMCEASHSGYFRVSIRGPEVAHAAYYRLYRVENPKIVAGFWEKPSGTIRAALTNEGKEKCYYLRAVNHVGYEDDNTTKVCTTPIKGTTTEPTNESDAGPTDDAKDPDSTNKDNTTKTDSNIDVRVGCGCQSTHDAPSVSVVLLVLFLLASRLRTRSQR